MSAHDLFHEGKLDEALAAQSEPVRNHPTDQSRRIFLAEILCVTGDLDRADKQLDTVGHQDPKAMPVATIFRHLIRAAQARIDCFETGRVPDLLGELQGSSRLLLQSLVHLRGGDNAQALGLIEQAEAERVRPRGVSGETPFDDFRDLDDVTASILEVFTSAGQYYWVPLERVELIEFREPERPRDLLWRPARLIVRDGPDGEVFLPCLYPGASSQTNPMLRVGRETEWLGGEGSPVRGVGQRIFLVGEEAVPMLELTTLSFEPPPGTESA